jgi:hypothetical protein
MPRITIITRIALLLEAARASGEHRRAQHCRRALRRLGAVA